MPLVSPANVVSRQALLISHMLLFLTTDSLLPTKRERGNTYNALRSEEQATHECWQRGMH